MSPAFQASLHGNPHAVDGAHTLGFLSLAWELGSAGLWRPADAIVGARSERNETVALRPGLGFHFLHMQSRKNFGMCLRGLRRMPGFAAGADVVVWNEGNYPSMAPESAVAEIEARRASTRFVYWRWPSGQLRRQAFWTDAQVREAGAASAVADVRDLADRLKRTRPELFETCSAANHFCNAKDPAYVSTHYCLPGIGGTLARLLLDRLLRGATCAAGLAAGRTDRRGTNISRRTGS